MIEIDNLKDLNSAENNQQTGWIAPVENGINYEVLSHNKDLTYTDYLNLSQAVRILGEFFDVNAGVIVKENLICSVALSGSTINTCTKIVETDPISVSGSTFGFSKSVDLETAKQLKSLKIRNVISTGYEKEAFKYLLDTDLNIIKINTPLHEVQGFNQKDIKVTPLGILIQEQNLSKLGKDNFTVVSEAKPTQEQVEDAIFAWKISKHLKNKSIVIAKELSTKAIVQAEPNETIATEKAMDIACEYSKDAVLSVDAEISNQSVINAAIQGRIGLIIESGDGKKSKDLLKQANKYGLSVIYTKIRNNKY